MLTIFCVPKPFIGHIDIIQRNAIQSWARLHPDCEIILCGDETGVEQVASEFKTIHIPTIGRNEFGTPLLNSAFDQVEHMASHHLMCYVNADIILLSDFMEAVKRVRRFQRFLMVGQRWDVDVTRPVDFEQPDWEERLCGNVAEYGVLHPPAGGDYFVFPKNGAIGKLLPFSVGRPGWDNWFIYKARKLCIPVVDVTMVVTVIHQNHDYSHLPDRTDEDQEGPESKLNIDLIGSRDHVFTLQDANWVLTPQGLRRPKWTINRLGRFTETLFILHPRFHPILSLGQALWRRVPKIFFMGCQR